MKNKIVITYPNGKVQTEIYTTDGVTLTDIHRQELSDVDILFKLKSKKFYTNFSGSWELTIPDQHKVFVDNKFITVIDMTIAYMHERDTPDWMDNYII